MFYLFLVCTYIHTYLSILPVCVPYIHTSPWVSVMDNCELICRCWETNLDPLNADSSLQPTRNLKVFFFFKILSFKLFAIIV